MDVFLGMVRKQSCRLSTFFGATFAPDRKTSASLNRNERSCCCSANCYGCYLHSESSHCYGLTRRRNCGLSSESPHCYGLSRRTFHYCGYCFPYCCSANCYCFAGRSNCRLSGSLRSGWNCATNEPATGKKWRAMKMKRGFAGARNS